MRKTTLLIALFLAPILLALYSIHATRASIEQENARHVSQNPPTTHRYRVEGADRTEELRLTAIPQSGRVTVNAKEKKLGKLLEEISRQSGITVECGFSGEDALVSLSVEDAPFLVALGELCVRHRFGLELVDSSKGRVFQIETNSASTPVLAYEAHGPLMITWHGLSAVSDYNFDNPQKLLKITKWRLGHLVDPRAGIEVGGSIGPLRETAVTFTVDGNVTVLRSDHKPNVFASGVPTWEFAPEKLTGKRAAARVRVPFLAPQSVARGTVAWKQGSRSQSGAVLLTVEEAATAPKEIFVKGESFKVVKGSEWKAVVKLIHSQSKDESVPPDAKVFRARDAWIVDKSGKKHKAVLDTASGISSPWDGFPYEIECETTDPAAIPASIEIAWTQDYTQGEQVFELKGLSLAR